MKSGRNYNYCFKSDVCDTKISKLEFCNISRSLVFKNVLGQETWLIFNNSHHHKDRKGVILYFLYKYMKIKHIFLNFCSYKLNFQEYSNSYLWIYNACRFSLKLLEKKLQWTVEFIVCNEFKIKFLMNYIYIQINTAYQNERTRHKTQ